MVTSESEVNVAPSPIRSRTASTTTRSVAGFRGRPIVVVIGSNETMYLTLHICIVIKRDAMFDLQSRSVSLTATEVGCLIPLVRRIISRKRNQSLTATWSPLPFLSEPVNIITLSRQIPLDSVLSIHD